MSALVDETRWPHDEAECHGSRCSYCGCCMHSDGSTCKVASAPAGMTCPESGCGCEGRS